MKKYYIVDKESEIAKAYKAWKEEQYKINDAFRELAVECGIETKEYYPVVNSLWIVPTKNDREKFKDQVKKSCDGEFKKGSPISKLWLEKIKEKEIQDLTRPHLMFYFSVRGRCREGMTEVCGTFYATYESECDFECLNEAFKEIKASEYYKAMEDAGAL
jgi:hypothetical protein